jgi:hypothetical protein
LRIAQARRGDIIDIGWLALYPDRIRIEHDGTMKVMRDWTYEQILAELDGKDQDYIRQCPECGRLFRKKRKDQAVCGPGCRVRKSTNKNPDKKLEFEVKRAQRDYLRDIEKRRNKLEHAARLKAIPSGHERRPRVIKSPNT